MILAYGTCNTTNRFPKDYVQFFLSKIHLFSNYIVTIFQYFHMLF